MLFLSSCSDGTAPPGPPYLAIVTNLYTLDGATAPERLTYRVRGYGPLASNRTLRVTPTDTLILSVKPATYEVDLTELPTRCVVSNGRSRGIVLSDADNTGLIRFNIQCRGILNIAAIVDGGAFADPSFVYRVVHADGTEFLGTLAANDTTTINDADGGEYDVQLGGIAPNCTVVSDGGSFQHVSVEPTGGATVSFRVACSDLAHRPQLLSLVSGYERGASIFSFRVWDPDGDLDGYMWDLTDCHGNSVLTDRRERIRRGLRSGRGQLSDTLVVVGAYEYLARPEDMLGKCTEIRVFDVRGNSSVIRTHRIGSATGFSPVVRFFNATLSGTAMVTSLLAASDPENDIIGHFVLVRLRDGALGPNDGLPDLGSMDPAGYLGLEVAPIPTTGRIKWDDVLAVMIYLIDAKGNVVRVEDADIFR